MSVNALAEWSSDDYEYDAELQGFVDSAAAGEATGTIAPVHTIHGGRDTKAILASMGSDTGDTVVLDGRRIIVADSSRNALTVYEIRARGRGSGKITGYAVLLNGADAFVTELGAQTFKRGQVAEITVPVGGFVKAVGSLSAAKPPLTQAIPDFEGSQKTDFYLPLRVQDALAAAYK